MSTCKRRCFFHAKNKEVQYVSTRFIVDDRSGIADVNGLLGNLVVALVLSSIQMLAAIYKAGKDAANKRKL